MMRLWIRAFGVAFTLAALVASGRCDDTIYQNYVASFATADAPTAPPTASALSGGAGQPCDTQASMPAAMPSPFAGDLCERPFLLGDLCGARDELAAHGISINVDTYQFYQGVAAGGVHDVGEYAGRNDYFINVDGEKAGLWKGFFITLHGETRYGDTVNLDTGAILPVNMPEVTPKATGSETALTAVKFTQGAVGELRHLRRQAQHVRRVQDALYGRPTFRRLLERRHVVSRCCGQDGALLDPRGPEPPFFKTACPSLRSWCSTPTTRRPPAALAPFSTTGRRSLPT